MVERPRYRNSSVARALTILGLFESGRENLTLSEIARIMDTSPSGVYSIVNTLEELGCLERSPDTKKYRLGLKLLSLASRLLDTLDVRDVAKKTLRKLASERRGNSHLAVLFENEVLYIDTEVTAATFVLPEIIGRRVPPHCTALGKVLLAHTPEAFENLLASGKPLEQITSKTVTSSQRLRQELMQISERGYALDREEFHEGIVCVAAPIRNYRGLTAAALSVSISASRLKHEPLSQFIGAVIAAAEDVSRGMGYTSQ